MDDNVTGNEVQCGIGNRPQFGARFLEDKNDVFKHNAWDNVVWDETQEVLAKCKVKENCEVILPDSEVQDLQLLASQHWDQFYAIHQNRFFKDRHWLFTEFPELAPNLVQTSTQKLCTSASVEKIVESELSKEQNSCTVVKIDIPNKINESVLADSECHEAKDAQKRMCELKLSDVTSYDSLFPGASATFRILELGCGVGNTIFPILEINRDPNLFVYGCDFSQAAIDLVKANSNYNSLRCCAFVSDVTSNEWNTPFPKESLDVIVCIFVLSAFHPSKLPAVVSQMAAYLRPGGTVLFRDYGRYDMAQLRFKKGRCLGEHFYARGHGTLCYFFTQDDIRKVMTDAGLSEVQNLVDRRLQVNRGKQLKMYRVWIQAKYSKPFI